MPTTPWLEGSVAIVTGAARGIGAAIAARLAEERATVVVADIDGVRAQTTATEISARTGGQALGLCIDVSKRHEAAALIAHVADRFQRVDILVNNAGVAEFGVDLEDLPEDQWRRVLGINLDGVFFCTQAVVPMMKSRRVGRIVNIAALGGKIGSAAATADYAASKGGVLALTKYCARVLAAWGITVNAVIPGPIGGDTMSRAMTADALDRAARSVPLGRLGRPDDIASVVVFLVSPDAAWITGEAVDVNGGFFID